MSGAKRRRNYEKHAMLSVVFLVSAVAISISCFFFSYFFISIRWFLCVYTSIEKVPLLLRLLTSIMAFISYIIHYMILLYSFHLGMVIFYLNKIYRKFPSLDFSAVKNDKRLFDALLTSFFLSLFFMHQIFSINSIF